MRSRWIPPALLSIALLVQAKGDTSARPDLVEHAASVVRRLQLHQYDSILDDMHHPSSFTREQIDEDRKAILAGMEFVASEFGELEAFAPLVQPVVFYKVELMMGTADYWTHLPNLGISAEERFQARYTSLQSGVVQITYFDFGGKPRIRSIDFGMLASEPQASERIASLGKRLFEAMSAVSGNRQSSPEHHL